MSKLSHSKPLFAIGARWTTAKPRTMVKTAIDSEGIGSILLRLPDKYELPSVELEDTNRIKYIPAFSSPNDDFIRSILVHIRHSNRLEWYSTQTRDVSLSNGQDMLPASRKHSLDLLNSARQV